MASRGKGRVKWFNSQKGFGFIEQEDGQDIFVHYSGILIQNTQSPEQKRSLSDGQLVEYDLTQGAKGLCAERVTVL